MGGVLGDLDGGVHLHPGGQNAGLGRLLIGGLGQLGHLLPGGLDHVAHIITFSIKIKLTHRFRPNGAKNA